MKKIFQYFIIILLIYLYLHNPLFAFLGGVGSIKLLYPFFAIIFITSFAVTKKSIFELRKEILVFVLIYLYLLIRTINNPDIKTYYTGIVRIIETYFIPIGLVIYLLNRRVDKFTFSRIILVTGSVGGIISTLCFFFPYVQEYIRNMMVISDDSYLANNLFRGFGLSEGLTYSYGIIQATICSYGLLNLKNNKWFIFFIPFMILSVLFNARMGIFIILIGVILYALSNKILNIIIVCCFGAISIIFLYPYVYSNMSEEGILWLNDFFEEIRLFTRLEKGNTTTVLFEDMIVLPENTFQWIFGRGESMFLDKQNTDMGWLLQLNLGGVVYVALLFCFLVLLYNHIKKCGMDKYIILLMIGTICIANTKGDFLTNSGGYRLLILLSYYEILSCKFLSQNK